VGKIFGHWEISGTSPNADSEVGMTGFDEGAPRADKLRARLGWPQQRALSPLWG
jgi:hypothetical protein